MKNSRSLRITALLIRTAIVLCFVTLFMMPYAAEIYERESFRQGVVTVPLLITFYSCAVFGFVILFTLDRLVKNIAGEKVFTEENVKLLRLLSYCCFFISLITLFFARLRLMAFIVTFAAAFFGLILRVLKNCFEQALRLKEENDYTI